MLCCLYRECFHEVRLRTRWENSASSSMRRFACKSLRNERIVYSQKSLKRLFFLVIWNIEIVRIAEFSQLLSSDASFASQSRLTIESARIRETRKLWKWAHLVKRLVRRVSVACSQSHVCRWSFWRTLCSSCHRRLRKIWRVSLKVLIWYCVENEDL